MNKIQGKICISTGALDSATLLSEKLAKIGADAYNFPMIEINQLHLPKDFTEAIDSISSYKWLMFTSKNGVHTFFNLLKEYKGSYFLPNAIKIATIGSKTASIIEEYKHKAEFICSQNNAKDFAREFAEYIQNKKVKVLFPTGNLTQNMIALTVPNTIEIVKIITYKTEPPKHIDSKITDSIKNNTYNHIIFTSPSSIRNFVNLFGDVISLDKLKAVSIGPSTTKQMEALGITPQIEAKTHNIEGIVEALETYYL